METYEVTVCQIDSPERLFALWDEYLQLCEENGQYQSYETRMFGNQFIEKLWSDGRLKDYTWFVVDEENFPRKNRHNLKTTEETCRVYALGSVEESTAHDLVEKFVQDISEVAVNKEIYVFLPLVLTTAISQQTTAIFQQNPLLNKKMWATWISVF